MKKGKHWLYGLVSCLLVGVVLFVVVFFDKDNPIQSSNNLKNSNVSIVLNTPETIKIFKGKSVELPSDAVVVKPENRAQELTYEIIVKSNGIENGISFENNIITAHFVGNYAIKFIVYNNSMNSVSKELKIEVHEDETLLHVLQDKNQFYQNEQINISSLFTICLDLDYSIITDLEYANGIFRATSEGEYEIKSVFVENGVKYFYKFNIYVLPTPLFTIDVAGVDNNQYTLPLETKTKTLGYVIRSANNTSAVHQSVIVNCEDASVVSVSLLSEGLLYIRALKVGETNVTLTYSYDTSITYTFKIIVI